MICSQGVLLDHKTQETDSIYTKLTLLHLNENICFLTVSVELILTCMCVMGGDSGKDEDVNKLVQEISPKIIDQGLKDSRALVNKRFDQIFKVSSLPSATSDICPKRDPV